MQEKGRTSPKSSSTRLSVSVLILVTSPSENLLLYSILQVDINPNLNLSMEKIAASSLHDFNKIELIILGGS